jgi:hypothetical protein
MSSGRYEMSLDDVRKYLIDSGAIRDAESFLHVQSEQTNSETKEKQELSGLKTNDIRDRITRERDLERENIMRSLLSEKRMDATAFQKEEEEIKKLQVSIVCHASI